MGEAHLVEDLRGAMEGVLLMVMEVDYLELLQEWIQIFMAGFRYKFVCDLSLKPLSFECYSIKKKKLKNGKLLDFLSLTNKFFLKSDKHF